MHEDIINAFQKTNNQNFLGPNNRRIDAVIFLQHSNTVKTIYHFLIARKDKQLITEDKFNQKIVGYIKNMMTQQLSFDDGERNPSKQKKITQETFDKICKDPQRARLIAHENGIQF